MVANARAVKAVERTLVSLVMDFDTARRAFELQTAPGWDEAAEQLKHTLDAVRDIGDVSLLPCPVLFRNVVHGHVRLWLEAAPDVRRGLTESTAATVKALSAYINSTIATPEHRGPIAGRRS